MYEAQEQNNCSICLTIYFQPVSIKQCKHIFCQPCIEEATQNTDQKKCPLCRSIFKHTDLIPQLKLRQKIQNFFPSELEERMKTLKSRIDYKVLVGNTTKVLQTESNNKYEWLFYVEPKQGEPPLSKYADRVQVYLHPTFHPNKIIYPAAQKVQMKRIGWGTFRIDVKIVWKKKYGGYTDVFHDLSFSPKKQNIITCKISRDGSK